jgi:hypothetical protein
MVRHFARCSLSVAALAAHLIALPVAAEAHAVRTKAAGQLKPAQPRLYAEPDRFGWYPRDANRLKIGSRIWFDQMEAEGRFGGSRRIH